jgi:glycosyltransferase involved in cell wall biosynthesis
MNRLSVVVITYNEEKNIGRCLKSVLPIADEIIVLDAWSTDNTISIAKSYGARVFQDAFTGYIQQKNKALAFADNDYVLSLDADEAIDTRLREAILARKAGFSAPAYSMNRCTNYCGKFIRRGTWYPDAKVRLFDKRLARWAGTNPHDKIELRLPDQKIEHLPGDILHHSFPSIEEHIYKSNKYSSIAARAMWLRGKKSNWFKMLINPFWAFFHCYFIRLGLLEGFSGFAIAVISAHSTFLKYAKLYHLQHSMKPAVKGGIFSPAEHAKAL